MSAARRVSALRVEQFLHRVLANRLEHSIARMRTLVAFHQQ
jgi:hypothetical protein